MHRLIHVIRHEFKLTAANKAYVILTLLGPFLIFAITVLPSLLVQEPGAIAKGNPLALYGAPPAVQSSIAAAFSGMGIEVEPILDEVAAKKSVLAGTSVALLSIEAGWPDSGRAVWYSKSGAEIALFSTASAVLEAAAKESRIVESGIDPAIVARLLTPPSFEIVKLEAGGKEESAGQDSFFEVLMTALVFVMMIYMTVLLYGQMIGRSVVTEKTSKTVEIMLSSVTSRDLMFGKILGLGLAGLLQYAIWVAMSLLLTLVVGPFFNMTMPAGLSMANMGWLVLFFVLAFFLYSSAYAAMGAASEDEQHLGQMAWPLLIFLMVPLVMISTLVTNPDSSIAIFLSIFPMTSPIVMLVRVLVSDPPAWQLGLCLAILCASVVGMAFLAAKIFRVGILMTGKRPSLKEVVKWLAVKS
ncbi:MAG: ABC transporter permease [Rectinemataceae bacterium]|nr:ABC transporter permease [Rectinemataceae bacterium]